MQIWMMNFATQFDRDPECLFVGQIIKYKLKLSKKLICFGFRLVLRSRPSREFKMYISKTWIFWKNDNLGDKQSGQLQVNI